VTLMEILIVFKYIEIDLNPKTNFVFYVANHFYCKKSYFLQKFAKDFIQFTDERHHKRRTTNNLHGVCKSRYDTVQYTMYTF
jgi:hypothetical protein